MATLDAETTQHEFMDWLAQATEDLEVEVAVKREDGQWYALLMQFDITGAGATRHDAVRDAFSLLAAYLHAYFEDGAAFEEAVRPVPRSLKLRIVAESGVAHVVRRISEKIPFASESHYALPPGTLPDLAH
jgi:hypothetical protein